MAVLCSKIANIQVRFSYGAQSGSHMPPIPYQTIIFGLQNGAVVNLAKPCQVKEICHYLFAVLAFLCSNFARLFDNFFKFSQNCL